MSSLWVVMKYAVKGKTRNGSAMDQAHKQWAFFNRFPPKFQIILNWFGSTIWGFVHGSYHLVTDYLR